MATLQTSSRLELLQAWFQQRQLMEKEQKLLQIYDQQQQRAHQVAQRGSAGSNTSNGSECSGSGSTMSHQPVTKTTNTTHTKSNSHGGKVRQMFDERRQTTVKGIDKSYPLEPLENKTRRANGTIPVKNQNKNSIVTRKSVTSKRTSGIETNRSIKKGSILQVSYHEEVTRDTFGPKLIHQNEDIDEFYSVDHVKPHYNQTDQHSQNIEAKYSGKKYNQATTKIHTKSVKKTPSKHNNSNITKASAPTPIGATSRIVKSSDLDTTTDDFDSPLATFENENCAKNENRPPSRRQSCEIQQISPTSTRPASTISTTIAPISTNNNHNSNNNNNNNNSLGQGTAINSPKIEMTARSQTVTSGSKSIPPSSRRNSASAINDSTVSCKICGRTFTPDRLNLHEQICAKTVQKKRKTFDITSQRVKGTEMEPFVKQTTKKGQTEKKTKKPEVKSNWRRKHEDFINAIRSAKQVQAHLAAGGKLSDLPPPPPSDTSDYIQCPHCERKFNRKAAERHIPKCEHMLHNKSKSRAPSKSKR